MNEEHLKKGLNNIAAQHISDEKDVWPKVQAGLSHPQERSAPTRMIPKWGMVVAAVVMIGLVAGMVPSVRARLVDLAETIGGVDFIFADAPPVIDKNAGTMPCEEVPIEELDSILASSIPSWAPDGYVLEPEANVCDPSALGESVSQKYFVILSWRRGSMENILMTAFVGGWRLGITDVEVVNVDGHDLTLWYGYWGDEVWDESLSQNLTWSDGVYTFTLQTDTSFPVDALVEMAASTFE